MQDGRKCGRRSYDQGLRKGFVVPRDHRAQGFVVTLSHESRGEGGSGMGSSNELPCTGLCVCTVLCTPGYLIILVKSRGSTV